MIEWIITSCVLIVTVLLLRLALKGKISLGLQYALWVLVLVRLLIPVNFFSSPMSVMNMVPEPEPAPAVELPQEITPTEHIDLELPEPELPQIDYSAPAVEQTPSAPTVTVIPDRSPSPTVEETPAFSLKQILLGIWVLGMAVSCAVIAAANIRFALRLKRSRQKVESDCRLPVYSTGIIDTPCLFGILRPAIYLAAEELEEGQLLHVLTHELTHYRHLDHIWALFRSLCLVLHWYNPLVWVAAILSRRDAELACDQATIRRLGEDSRAEYGKTLIRMTCAKQELGSILTTATTMTGSKKTITQRIRLIAKHPKTAALAIICLVLAAAIAVGCTFTGANEPANEENTTPVVETATVTDKPAAEVLTEHYELSKLREFFGEYETYYASSIEADPITLSQVYDQFPDFCIKKDYAVISVLDGGYYYVFWSQKGSSEVGDEIDLTNATVENTIYVPRICVASDFDGIVIDESTADDIKAIDPTVIIDYGLDSFGGAYSRGHEHYCFILLKDGTGLFVGFDYSDSSEETLMVKEMEAVTELHGPGWWFDISEEDWPREAGVNSLPSDTKITLAEYLTQTGLDINAPYLHFDIDYEGKNYYFSSHNYLFMYNWYVLIHSSFKPKEQTGFDDSLDYICIYVQAAYGTAGAIYVNEADQLKVGDDNYYEVPGLYGEIEYRISEHTEKSDRYFEVDETGPTTTYTVYGFDKVDENNRRPYYLYLTDDNFVYVWSQYGTGTIARMSKFYDPTTGRVSPEYRAPTDYYQNMVVCYYDPEDPRSYGDITIVDMFSGQVLFKVDEKDLPADRNLAFAADTVYFNYDGSQIILDYHTDGFVRKWHTINIPPEVRLNRTVTIYKTTDQLPRYNSGTLTQKPWEDSEVKASSNIPVPDQQAATEIAEAVINAHFTGYKTTAVGFHPTEKVWVVSLSNGSKDLMIAISWQDVDILGVWESDVPYEVGTTPWVKAKNILTAPYIADKETAGLIGEAIRAGISRQAGLYHPHSCVQDVYYEESAGYWLIRLCQHAQYPVDQETIITIDEKDGHIVKMWYYSY